MKDKSNVQSSSQYDSYSKSSIVRSLEIRELKAKSIAYVGIAIIIAISYYLIIGFRDISSEPELNQIDKLVLNLKEVRDLHKKYPFIELDVLESINEKTVNGKKTYDTAYYLQGSLEYISWIISREVFEEGNATPVHKEKGDTIYFSLDLDRWPLYKINQVSTSMSDLAYYIKKHQEFVEQKFKPTYQSAIDEIQDSALASFGTAQGITFMATRIGSVLIALYLIQILLMFTRYQFRYADYLHGVTTILKYTNNSTASFEELSKILDSSHIHIGKYPSTPIKEITEILRASKGA